MLINDETGDGIFTLDKRGPGQILGWTNLLRGEATEFINGLILIHLPPKLAVH